MIHFAQPHWLIFGLFVSVAMTFAFRQLQKRRQATLEKFAAHQLLGRLTRTVSTRKRRYKNLLLLLAVFLCFAALARPQYGSKWIDVKRKGIDLLFAVDTSKSMLAQDIKPNRLKRAHLAILDFVQQLDGDRVGLMPFAGSAYLMCPLTLDYEAFGDSLAAVSTDIIPRGGTNIAAVIDKAIETLNNEANHKILIILTDGENLQGDAVLAAARGAEQGLTIYTVGVGTSQGELVPLSRPGSSGFVKDEKGNFVTSRLDEQTLTAIAQKSKGLYVPLGTAGEGLETIYQQKLTLIPKKELAERRQKVPLERFEWPLAGALCFLVLELLTGERRKSRSFPLVKDLGRRIWRRRKATRVAAILLLLSLTIPVRGYCSRGEEAFARGDYLGASEYYRKELTRSPDDPELQYNYGTAAYKNNMFDDAIEAFGRALASDDVELQKKAYYNRGNSYYQKGVESQQADQEKTVDMWQQALKSLDSVLQLAPEDSSARENHLFIKKRLDELKKQQEQQKNQDRKNDGEQDGEDQNSGQDKKQQDQNQQQESSKKDSFHQDSAQPEEQKQDRQQSQQEQEDKGKGEKKGEGNSQDKPQPINKGQSSDKNPDQQAKQDALRQQLGKMTREEAERLLNALKNEEGELNFVPTEPGGNEENIDKDW